MPISSRKHTIEKIKQTLDSKEISGKDKFELLKEVFSDTTIDKYVVLDLGIKYLNNIKNPEVAKYKADSVLIMKKLHNAFYGNELYKPWVRYFDVTYKVKEELRGKETLKIFQKKLGIFKSNISDLVQKLLFENGNNKIDWRIAKKMLAVSENLFEKNTIDIFQQGDLFKPISVEIKKALDFLLWKDPENVSASTQLATNILNKLQKHLSDQARFIYLKDAILSGRFDKKKFELPNTALMGEDGGMYLLLNNLTRDNEQVIKEVISDDYLEDKLQQKGEKQQITIGKGGFGTVRFALSLFDAKSKPGELVCIKKTKNINGLETTCSRIIDETLKDYFTNDIADIIYSPNVFDIVLVTQDVGNSHRKGYLIMEMLPQNTATKIFANPVYQKWEYQKPYLLDVFKKTLDLLDKNVVITDLKPDNTLYNTDTRKATIIDLGGTVKIDNIKEKTRFNIRKYSFHNTEMFSALELQQKEGVIDISKALAFSCGKIIQDITKINNNIISTDINQDQVNELKFLAEGLINSIPEERISIEEAIEKVEAISDDSYKENIIFTHYVNKIKERLRNNKSSIGINEDIERTKDLYIELYTTKLNPYRYSNLETDILFSKIDDFWHGQEEVMLLLGVAGAGKSITLQLKFMEAVKNWKPGIPLPIYFNLGSNIDLVTVIDSLNNELGTNLKLNDIQNTHLYIDSFNEGIGIATNRETLIREYIAKLGKPKILISCQTGYLPDDNDYSWFMPNSGQLEVYYIAPINYSKEQKLEEYVSKYVKKCSDIASDEQGGQNYLDKISQLKIESIIDTAFMFEIVMQSVSSLHISSTIEKPISKQDIYDKYVEIKQSKKVADVHEKQKEKIIKLLLDLNKGIQNLNQLLKELAKCIAVQLHLQNEFRIKSDSELFKAFEYEESTLFRQQVLYHILKLLPLKIETKTLRSRVKVEQEVEIGFAHIIFKNYYLFEAIKDEVKRSGKSEILASRSIIEDVELIKLIAEDVVYSKDLQLFLRQAIDVTKEDKSDVAITFAANSITLLIAAQYSFSGEDLSNVTIKGANIRNGIFQYADFSKADLTGVNLTNANLTGAKFIGTNMIDVKLSIHPDLKYDACVNCVSYSPNGEYIAIGYSNGIIIWDVIASKALQSLGGYRTRSISCISYSPDGKYLFFYSLDKTLKVWDIMNGKILQNLAKTIDNILCISYTLDGKCIALDKTLNIWDITNMKVLKNLAGDTDKIACVSYSPNGKYIALGSTDGIVSIRNVDDGKILQNLVGHTDDILCISYSPDGEYLVSSSWDGTVKIWDIKSEKILQNLGHTDKIACVSYSPNGKYIALGSTDGIVSIRNVDDSKILQNLVGHTDDILCISYSPDGEYLASGSSDRAIKIWDIRDEKILQNLVGHTDDILCISYSPDGEYLASCSWDGTVKIWDTKRGKILQNLVGHTDKIACVSYSPNGKYIASGSINGIVSIWDVNDGKLLKDLIGHISDILCISYSPDGVYLASCSLDRTVKIWNITDSKEQQTLAGYTNDILYVSYSPDSEHLAICFLDRAVKIWNIIGKEYQTLVGCHDGNYIASCAWYRVVAPCGGVAQTLAGYTDKAACVSYSPNGEYLALGSWDRTIKIWNIKEGKIFQNLAGHIDKVTCVSYSPDGKYLASGSLDRTVKIWKKKSTPQSEEIIWYLTKEISATESPLVVEDAIIEEAIISTKNQTVFKQKGAKVANNITENKEIHSNERDTFKKISNKEPYALLKDKLVVATEQRALKLVKVKSKYIKEDEDMEDIVVGLISIKYDNHLLNNPMLLKKLAGNLNIDLNQVINASDYLTYLLGSKDFSYICDFDQNLLQKLLGNYFAYEGKYEH